MLSLFEDMHLWAAGTEQRRQFMELEQLDTKMTMDTLLPQIANIILKPGSKAPRALFPPA